jgi:hypothetical protein
LLNSLPGRLDPAKVMVPPVALVNVTIPVPAFHAPDVDAFVQVPATVQVDAPRLIELAAVRTFTLPVTLTVEFRALKVPWTLKGPLIVRAQFDAVVSSVPANPVMSMLAIVVFPVSVVVPVGTPLKIALFDAIGVHPQDPPP